MGRQAFRGNAEELRLVLDPIVRKYGKHWCRYNDESKDVRKANLVIPDVQAHRDLLNALHGLQPNLCFDRNTVRAAIAKIATSGTHFRMREAVVANYVETLTCRVQNLCHVVKQGMNESRLASWVQMLPWFRTSKKRPSGHADEGGGWVIEFNEDAMVAERSKSGNPPKEASLPLAVTDEDDPNKEVVAQWSDGTRFSVLGLSVEMWRFLQRTSHTSQNSVAILWSSEHSVTKRKVVIKEKVCQELYMAMYVQTKEMCRVRMDFFAPIEDQKQHTPRDHPACIRTLAFMQQLAARFCKGEIAAKQLQNVCDDELLKIATNRTPVARRTQEPITKTSDDTHQNPNHKRQATSTTHVNATASGSQVHAKAKATAREQQVKAIAAVPVDDTEPPHSALSELWYGHHDDLGLTWELS